MEAELTHHQKLLLALYEALNNPVAITGEYIDTSSPQVFDSTVAGVLPTVTEVKASDYKPLDRLDPQDQRDITEVTIATKIGFLFPEGYKSALLKGSIDATKELTTDPVAVPMEGVQIINAAQAGNLRR